MFRVYVTIILLVICLNSCKAIDTDRGAATRVDSLDLERDSNLHGTQQQHYDLENNGKGSIACPSGYAEKGLC